MNLIVPVYTAPINSDHFPWGEEQEWNKWRNPYTRSPFTNIHHCRHELKATFMAEHLLAKPVIPLWKPFSSLPKGGEERWGGRQQIKEASSAEQFGRKQQEQGIRLILSGFRYKLLYFSFGGSKMKQFRRKKEFRKEILFLPTQQGCTFQLLRGNNIKCNTRGSLEAEAEPNLKQEPFIKWLTNVLARIKASL